jgi:hypothetical protein
VPNAGREQFLVSSAEISEVQRLALLPVGDPKVIDGLAPAEKIEDFAFAA